MLDSDLAEAYGVPTKRLNEQVKRNQGRFPPDFMFRLTADEAGNLLASRTQKSPLKKGQNIKYCPHAFTEHGAVMLAGVLNSPIAVQASVQVVRAFIRLRRVAASHRKIARKLDALERTIESHDGQIRNLFDALQGLTAPTEAPSRRIGFFPD